MLNILPRKDLREPAFRKYRHHIEMAARCHLHTIPPYELGGRSASTWVQRFTDAKTGYKRYHYQCDLPLNFNIDFLVARECADGSVTIINKQFEWAKRTTSFITESNNLAIVQSSLESLSSQPGQRINIRIYPMGENNIRDLVAKHPKLNFIDPSDFPSTLTIECPVDFEVSFTEREQAELSAAFAPEKEFDYEAQQREAKAKADAFRAEWAKEQAAKSEAGSKPTSPLG